MLTYNYHEHYETSLLKTLAVLCLFLVLIGKLNNFKFTSNLFLEERLSAISASYVTYFWFEALEKSNLYLTGINFKWALFVDPICVRYIELLLQ